jgi:hypothetical protein
MPEKSLFDNSTHLGIVLAAVLCMFEHCRKLIISAGYLVLCTFSDSATKVMVDRPEMYRHTLLSSRFPDIRIAATV